MPKDKSIKKVLVIGSGPIVIGQAAEFDYAGTEALEMLKGEGIETILINSNPATIMTDEKLASAVYLEPLRHETVKRIIEKERPDGILASLGGQTGLNLALSLHRDGTLEKYGVKLLGSDIEAIDRAEDRELFREAMIQLGVGLVPSDTAENYEDAKKIAEKIGYPVIIRPAFTLGGSGGGIAENEEEFFKTANAGLSASPIHQILVEKSIAGWMEIEFETIRDSSGEAVAVCSMENFDPVGVHTGDSIVVAPALSLSREKLGELRQMAIDIVKGIKVVGACNVQLAFNPEDGKAVVIEVNPRVSRSSALASKASAYPIARISTLLSLGYLLDEIRHPETGKSLKAFEPSLDYIVLKFPKWPFDKFHGASRKLGTQMKATGEVMSIAPSFEMALMKAVRGIEIGLDSLNAPPLDERPVEERLADQDDRRIFTIFEALKKGVGAQSIHEKTKIVRYFLDKLKHMADFENKISAEGLNAESYFEGRSMGYADKTLLRLSGETKLPCPAERFVYREVKTTASVFEQKHPYFYSVHSGSCEAASYPRSGKPVVIVLGSGPIRIGQGIEFDYCSVQCVFSLKKLGYEVVTVNNNPETVSTDNDISDRLYFEPLCIEDVLSIIEIEKPVGVVVAFGGQTAIKLTRELDAAGVKILGTSAEGIDRAEDRQKFDLLLEKVGIERPVGKGVMNTEEALSFCEETGYPVLLRPSYVIGGQNMSIAKNPEECRRYMENILSSGIENPVLIDRYMPGIELELDLISDGKNVLIPAILEHVERAGVHSGDSIALYPPLRLDERFLSQICEAAEKMALAIGTKGLINIQFLIYEDRLYVIELNPRASRTVPYITKVTKLPLVDIAVRVMMGEDLEKMGYGTGLYRTAPYAAVKVPVFSFEKLLDANSILGPEMKSTGEVLGIGTSFSEAMFKGLTAAGFTVHNGLREKDIGILLSAEESGYQEIISVAKRFYDLGLKLFATCGTAEAISGIGIEVLSLPEGKEEKLISELIEEGKLHYIVYCGALGDSTVGDYRRLHRTAMLHGIPCLNTLETASVLSDIMESRFTLDTTELIDIKRMRPWRQNISFSKMQAAGSDYIFIEDFEARLGAPESLCVRLCRDHFGIGSEGIVIIRKSNIADAKMIAFNKDGSRGEASWNNLSCVAKYLYDKGLVRSRTMRIESDRGVHALRLYLKDGKAGYVTAEPGKADFSLSEIAHDFSSLGIQDSEKFLNREIEIGGIKRRINLVSTGSPHCVIFADALDSIDIKSEGAAIENSGLFPEGIRVEFVRIVDRRHIRMRTWERGNGETLSCGSGAFAAAAVSAELGFCDKGEEIRVVSKGGELSVCIGEENAELGGSAELVFDGSFEY